MRRFVVLSLLFLLPAPGEAQTVWYVSSLCDDTGRGTQADPFCTPQEAVDVASSGDTVILGPGTYTQDVVVPGIQLTLRSSHGPEETELLGSQGAALELLAGAKLLVEDLTFSSREQARAGLISRQASLTVRGCRFVGTQGTVRGGAIQAEDTELLVRASTFESAFTYQGGAIAVLRGRTTLEGCRFEDLRAFMGAAVFAESCPLRVSECAFVECAASFGGALSARGAPLRIDDSLFLRSGGFDFDFQRGAALWLESVDATIAHSSFEEGVIFSSASALWLEQGSLELQDCSFTDNYVADLAGTVVVRDADARIAGCTFRDNQASAGWGGALYLEVGPADEVLVEDCLFGRNRAAEGGAVCVRRGFAELVRCRFTSNRAGTSTYYERGHGGGVFVGGFPMDPPAVAAALVRSCVFDRNVALGHSFLNAGRGAGVYGLAEVQSCTFHANVVSGYSAPDAPMGGAAGGGATLRNCVTWADRPEALDSSAIAAWSGIPGGWPGEGNFDANPGFRAPELGDFRLLPWSPCIDRGDPAQLDADGTRIDVGAFPFELDPTLARRR